MNQNSVYSWTVNDKWMYVLSLVPFLIVFIGAVLILGSYSVWLSFLLIFFFLISNLLQAGCCIGCPYRGGYCPAIFGVYLSNLLSKRIYPTRKFDQQFFDRNAAAAEIMLLVTALFPVYWVVKTTWWLLPIYLVLIGLHLALFLPNQCEKCSYNETCPGGITWRTCALWLKARN